MSARRLWRHPLVRGLVTGLLLVGVVVGVDDGRLRAALADIDWRWVGVALVWVQVQIGVSALRWRHAAACLGERFSRRHALGEYYLASLLNQVLPGGVTGDVIRAGRGVAGRRGLARRTPIHGVVLERLAGQIVLFGVAVLGAIGALLTDRALFVAVVGILATVAATVLGIGLVGWMLARYVPRIAEAFAGFLDGLRGVWQAPARLAWQIGYSVIVVAGYLGAFDAAATAVGAPLSLTATLVLVPVVLLAMLLPVSITGWGLREAAAALLWPLAGATAADGAAASIVYGAVSLVGAAPGLWWVLRRPRRHETGPTRA